MNGGRGLSGWGRLVYRFRWPVLGLSIVLLGLSGLGLLKGGVLTSGSPIRSNLEAARAADLIAGEIKSTSGPAGSSFILLFSSHRLDAVSPAFQQEVESALAPLQRDARVTKISNPYSVPADEQAQFVSKDGHSALALVTLRDPSATSQHYYPQLRRLVRSNTLQVQATGEVPIELAFNVTLESDLRRAETITLPAALVLLVLIFGSVVAASLPLGVGALAIAGGAAATLLLSRFTDVSQYALNIVTLIGLAVAIDYSLFIVDRFRNELREGSSVEAAAATTMATAGRAITFSGLTVAIGLSAMLFYQGTFLAAMGVAGAFVVAIAVFYGLTFLPAMLCILGPNVNRLPLRLTRRRRSGDGVWHRWANWIMNRPILFAGPALVVLLIAGLPFLHLRMANGSADELPPNLPVRIAFDQLPDFPSQNQNTFQVAVYHPHGSPLAPAAVAAEFDFGRRLKGLSGVTAVMSPVSISPTIPISTYQRLYAGDPAALPAPMRSALADGTGPHLMLFRVQSPYPASSDQARRLLRQIRSAPPLNGAQILVTGPTASDIDVINFIIQRTPAAVLFVVAVTYLVLFLLTGSVVLPLKAVLLNLVSIAASFGALVWIFQDGHLSSLLGFSPQSIDPTVPVLLFSIVFGMSMDYEVLLVSRIQEEYRLKGDARRAVAVGLERSGRLISGAAAIMVTVFLAFGLAEVVIIKSIGIGLALAVTLDATIVRLILVPAVMRLLGDRAWWAPVGLARLHSRIGLGGASGEELALPVHGRS